MRRLAREDGYTVVAAIATLTVVSVLVGAALSLALRRQDTAQRDRSVARAIAAADAGADVAGWRMSRALVSAGGSGLLGFTGDVVRQLGCTSVSAGSFSVISGDEADGWCPPTASEDLGDGASYTYSLSLDVTALGGGASETLERRVVVVGRAGGRQRRILVTYKLDLDAGTATTLFKRWRYVVCPAKPTGSRPDSGCPDPEI